MPGYTHRHATAGIQTKMPRIETWPSQFPGTIIEIEAPEYTSVCPKTNLPDFGRIVIRYTPAKRCLELKSLKLYLVAYRNLGIFYENAVNKILRDLAAACTPVWMEIRGEFSNRGGITTTVEARWPDGQPAPPTGRRPPRNS